MKAYKLEILIIDFDEVGEEGIIETLLNQQYPNDCVSLEIKNVKSRDIGVWSDDHPLNYLSTADAEYRRLFGSEK